jgi:hypothetical protein
MIDRFAAGEDGEPSAGLEGTVVHAYPDACVYIVEVHPHGGYGPEGPARWALLDVREEDLVVVPTRQM